MNDFTKWVVYYNHKHPDHTLQPAEMEEMYNRYYSCNCLTCEYRKEHGAIPMNVSGNPRCKAPTTTPLELE